jgi:hypothetical protein
MSSGEGARERINENEIEKPRRKINNKMGHFMQQVKDKGKKGCVKGKN